MTRQPLAAEATRWVLLIVALFFTACSERSVKEEPAVSSAAHSRPSILLITMDTTRADSIGPEARGVQTPAFNALAGRGRRYRYAYAAVPETLPSHISIMTGLYPAAHGIHDNARYLSSDHPLIAERLHEAGYSTAAFVSAFVLERRYGLGRGFDLYDDQFRGGRSERKAKETTDKALAYLQQTSSQPLFLWVHYFDPHHPYEPPEPFRARYSNQPYLGEIAAMDQEMGRLIEAFEKKMARGSAVIVVADHGEGLGDHGESQHGNLLYQSTMHVPLVLVGPGVLPGVVDDPVGTRRVFHTILDWAGLATEQSLRSVTKEVVAGEAMKPFLYFGWQPQVMAVEGRIKTIHSGRLEVYDVLSDPGERRDLSTRVVLSREVRQTVRDYPVPSLSIQVASADVSEEERRKLASLGYVAAETRPVIRKDAPRPIDMVKLFDELDRVSTMFVREEWALAIPILDRILAADPYNLMTALRLGAAHSALGESELALKAFRRAESIAPDSSDVRHYLALHYLRKGELQKAEPLLDRVLAETPGRIPAIEAMAEIRERQGQLEEAFRLRQRVATLKPPTAEDLIHIGILSMQLRNTLVAVQSFESARKMQGADFSNDLELGVVYLDAGQFQNARDALDRVRSSNPGYPMALFKRAQVSALLREPDLSARIDAARKNADDMTRTLIQRERLFQGVQ